MSVQSLIRRIFRRTPVQNITVNNVIHGVSASPATPVEPEIVPDARFWIIWNPKHPKAPQVKHFKKSVAEIVAKKMLAREKHRDDVLYIMQVSSAWTNKDEKPKARWF